MGESPPKSCGGIGLVTVLTEERLPRAQLVKDLHESRASDYHRFGLEEECLHSDDFQCQGDIAGKQPADG